MFSDALGRGAAAGSPTARIFTAVILAFGLAITLSFQASPVGLIVIAQSLTVLIAPLLGVLIVIMSNKTALMGDLRNRWWHNLLGAIGLIAIVASSLRLITSLLG
jgi:Mn2+/Fe2+ NRAMP family transporter